VGRFWRGFIVFVIGGLFGTGLGLWSVSSFRFVLPAPAAAETLADGDIIWCQAFSVLISPADLQLVQ
jgi:uncharacterized membrane protein YfcA